MARILVVASHPDDEILGCGATVLKRIKGGDEAYALVLGEGITARYKHREEAPKEELSELDTKFKKVTKKIGFKEACHLSFPDNRLDGVDLLDVTKAVQEYVELVKPDVIYTHFENDLNVDHRVCFQAVLTVCRPGSLEYPVKQIFSFETPSSTEWVSPGREQFKPNHFEEVGEFLEGKIEAMELYESESRSYPHPRSPEALRTIAKRWGIQAGLKSAEAFMLIRSIG